LDIIQTIDKAVVCLEWTLLIALVLSMRWLACGTNQPGCQEKLIALSGSYRDEKVMIFRREKGLILQELLRFFNAET